VALAWGSGSWGKSGLDRKRHGIFDAARKPAGWLASMSRHYFNDFDLSSGWHASCSRRRGGAFMSGKVLQLSPQTSTRLTRSRTTVHDSRSAQSVASLDLGFLPSWFESDSASHKGRRRINWGAISGIAISIVVSGGVWAGVLWMVARFWR
jgi:hypothetical protein